MGRGVSAGGGQSSLGYLFGTGEAPNPQPPPKEPTNEPPLKASATSPQADNSKQAPPAGNNSATNNYYRADGQNCGNFITDRPSTKVHSAPGGSSSLNYLFGDGKN